MSPDEAGPRAVAPGIQPGAAGEACDGPILPRNRPDTVGEFPFAVYGPELGQDGAR